MQITWIFLWSPYTKNTTILICIVSPFKKNNMKSGDLNLNVPKILKGGLSFHNSACAFASNIRPIYSRDNKFYVEVVVSLSYGRKEE